MAPVIDATVEGGFGDDVRRTVSENARTLKFETHEFEDCHPVTEAGTG